MKNLINLQHELIKNIRLSNNQFDKIEMKLIAEIKNKKLTPEEKKKIERDIVRLENIRKQLKDLETMESFFFHNEVPLFHSQK